MKKIISVLLSVVLTLSIFIPCVNAQNTCEDELYPTIIVAGYSSSSLYKVTENGKEQVWGVDIDEVLSAVLHNIAKIGIGLGGLAFGNYEYIANVVGYEFVNMYGDLAFDENGNSVNTIETYPKDAKYTGFSYLEKNENGEHMHESEIMATVAEEYEARGVENGNDWIFSFQTDFRRNIVQCATDLDAFIDSVREFTGKDKVNIYAVSHGGEVCSVYFSLFGAEKKAVNNAVLTIPAIGGAALAYDVISENIVFDEETLVYFLENGLMLEEDYNWLVKAHQFGILDGLCNSLIHNHVKKILGYWGSIWDFIPSDYYEDVKNKFLDPEKNAELIKKSNVYHNEIMPNMTQNLNDCLTAGINIYIVAGTDMPSVTGLQEQSDAMIRVKDSTGAYCAPYGMRFSDGYIQRGTVCSDSAHRHVSPSMNIDASCGFLPETTWYVNGLFHGMTWKDENCIELCKILLFTNDRITVHSFEVYPQFMYSQNRCYSVSARFDRSKEGYVCGSDTVLKIKNISHKYKMRIKSVYCAGADLVFNIKGIVTLAPGEEACIPFSGALPELGSTTLDLTVNYVMPKSITPFGYRTMTFTVEGTETAPYNDETPFTAAHHITVFEKTTDKYTAHILKESGLFDFVKMVYNSFVAIIRMIKLNVSL